MEVIRAIEVNWIDLVAGNKHLQVDDLGALQVESLQLVRCECDVVSAFILVSPDDLFFLDFLAGARMVRPESDPSCGANSFHLILDAIRSEARNGSVGGIWSSVLVRQIVRFIGRSCSPNLV